ncbi:HAD-IA family hydrolase [Myxococcota bacterium]|nr:HAD-IA family hydrolase [Myxococcota bacterium]
MNTAFLFDLDGTLLDSKGDLADAANAARRSVGLGNVTDAEVERHTGWGMAALLAGVIPEADAEMLARAREAFVAHYQRHLLVRSRPYPSVERMFQALADRPLGLVTNKPSMFGRPILETLGWAPRFGVQVFGDTVAARKPDPEPLLHGIRGLGRTPETCVFVGDTVIDRDTARYAGVRFVCVAWGRAAEGADHVVDDLAALAMLFP